MPSEDMDAGYYPNREWVWDMLFTIIPTWAHNYCRAVMQQRYRRPGPSYPITTNVIHISPEWMERLKMFDFKSKMSKYPFRSNTNFNYTLS